jgi:type I restriction enzyme S subunit
MKTNNQAVKLRDVLRHRKEFLIIDDVTVYKRARVQLHAQGIVLRDQVPGALIKTKKQQVCRAGEFLVAEIDAKVGGFGIVPRELDGAIVSSHYFLFEIDESKLWPRFLEMFIRTPRFRDQVAAQGSTNYAAIRPGHVLEYEMPLPPLQDQRRIVAEFQDVAERVGTAASLRREALVEAGAIVPSVLNQFFGDWYGGVAASVPVARWEKIGAVAHDVADGPHVTPTYVPTGVPFITVLNITSGRIKFGDHKFVTVEDHAQFCRRAKAEKGDVLISKDGTIGVPCYVDTDREFSFFVSVALIKPKREVLDGEFLTWALRAPYLQDRISKRSRGDMIRHLVLREIRDLTIPVPSLVEQRRIVAHMNEMNQRITTLKRVQNESREEIDAILPSLRDRVFNGHGVEARGELADSRQRLV